MPLILARHRGGALGKERTSVRSGGPRRCGRNPSIWVRCRMAARKGAGLCCCLDSNRSPVSARGDTWSSSSRTHGVAGLVIGGRQAPGSTRLGTRVSLVLLSRRDRRARGAARQSRCLAVLLAFAGRTSSGRWLALQLTVTREALVKKLILSVQIPWAIVLLSAGGCAGESRCGEHAQRPLPCPWTSPVLGSSSAPSVCRCDAWRPASVGVSCGCVSPSRTLRTAPSGAGWSLPTRRLCSGQRGAARQMLQPRFRFNSTIQSLSESSTALPSESSTLARAVMY